MFSKSFDLEIHNLSPFCPFFTNTQPTLAGTKIDFSSTVRYEGNAYPPEAQAIINDSGVEPAYRDIVPSPATNPDVHCRFEYIVEHGNSNNLAKAVQDIKGFYHFIDFGTGRWVAKVDPDFGFGTRFTTFKENSPAESFVLPPGNILKSMRICAKKAGLSYSISDGVNPDVKGTAPTGSPVEVLTSWVKSSGKVTITLSDSGTWESTIFIMALQRPPPDLNHNYTT